jgi:hypothetical protein
MAVQGNAGSGEWMPNKVLRLALGAMTGAVGLIAMIRLVSGAFSDGMTRFAWIAILLAMIPWIAYCAWRAAHGRLSWRNSGVVLGLCVIGLISDWLFTLGPVIALASSLVAFAVIWISDWPARRPAAGEQFVKIEELRAEDLD